MYLNIILLPPLDIYLLEKDELDEALDKKEISQEQYNLACDVVDRLMDDILNNRVMAMKRYETDINYMIKLIRK